MPTLNLGSDYTDGQLATAAIFNAKFQAIKDLLNTTKLDNANIQNLAIITALINDAAVTAPKIDPAVLAAIGVNSGSTVRRGKSIITTEEIRSNTAYGLMTTPDRVSSVVLPTDGLIRVWFQGMLKESVSVAARAAIFIGSNQLKIAPAQATAPVVQEVGNATGNQPNKYFPISTSPAGLISGASAAVEYGGDVTTGQLVGVRDVPAYDGAVQAGTGPWGGGCAVFAAAGTYDISVQTKSSSGSVTMKNRKLWVEAVSF